MTDLSPADLMAFKDDDGGMGGIWNNPFIYFVWMIFMRWFNNGDANGNLTRAELADGFRNQDVLSNQRSILDGLSTNRYESLQNLNSIAAAIADSRYAAQDCCCRTNNAITALSGENYKNTCEIVNAIRSDGEATRALINANTMQELRDKLADKDRALMTSELFSAQQAQTQNLVSTLRPFPTPAYITCSPYTSSTPSYCAGGCGCGA